MVKRSFLTVLLVTLLLAATTTIVYAADPEPEPVQQDEGGVDQVIGTLGLYAAMMAVLALGTEVVIDMVRPIFGLQRKMNVDEAFAKLKEQLPKTLTELEVSKKTQKQLKETIKEMEDTAKDFGNNAERARSILYEEWPDILTDLATQSVDAVFDRHWETIREELLEAGVPENSPELSAAGTWLKGAINNARETGIIDLQGPLTLVNGVLEEVKVQQNKIQSPFRKFWRWVRDSGIRLGRWFLRPDVNAWMKKAFKEVGLPQGLVDSLGKTLQDEWIDLLEDLVTLSAKEWLDKHWETIEKALKDISLKNYSSEIIDKLLGKMSNAEKGNKSDKSSGGIKKVMGDMWLNVPDEIENGLPDVSKLVQAGLSLNTDSVKDWLKKQLNRPVRRILRWVCFLPAYVEYGWARLRGTLEGGIKVHEGIKKLGEIAFEPARSLQEAAQCILEEDVQQGLREEKRVKWLRVISTVVGIILASILSLDSIQLLEPVLSSAANTFHELPDEGEILKPEAWYNLEQIIERADRDPDNNSFDPQRGLLGVLNPVLSPILALTPGVILSGLGAAAGSGFWHDVLDKLRATKQVSEMVKKAKEALGVGSGGP
jgi:predicted RecB family endonuclease